MIFMIQNFRFSFIFSICALVFLASNIAQAKPEALAGYSQAGFYQFHFKSLDNKPMPMAAYQGQVVLVVNTASQCGFTKQYADLEHVYQLYKDQGFVVIGVPCNNFGGQEPASEQDIAAFVKDKYGVTLPMTAKYDVKGDNAHPFFAWAAAQTESGFLKPSAPKWNFHKYLIDRSGAVSEAFGSHVNPQSDKMIAAIEKLLLQNVAP